LALMLEVGELLPGLQLGLVEIWSNNKVGLGWQTASNIVQPGLAAFKAALNDLCSMAELEVPRFETS
jgi:hypothetical protein